MRVTISKLLVAVGVLGAVVGAAGPASAAPAGIPVQPVAPTATAPGDTGSVDTGSFSNPGNIIIWPLGLSSVLLCKGEVGPDSSPVCKLIFGLATGLSSASSNR